MTPTPVQWQYTKLADGTWGAQAFGRRGRQTHTRTVVKVDLWRAYARGTTCGLRLEPDSESAAEATAHPSAYALHPLIP